MKTYSLFFTGTGTTKKISDTIAASIDENFQSIDIMSGLFDKIILTNDDIVIISSPVFSGRIPEIFIEKLRKISGNNAIAAIAVVYGNREYDDSLLELKNTVESIGFRVIGAGAFVARHSLVPNIAATRPDLSDTHDAKKFGKNILCKYQNGFCESVSVPGNFPYRPYKPVPLKPYALSKCVKCGLCAINCPVHAIDGARPNKTSKSLCISCGRCVSVCPIGARKFNPFLQKLAGVGLGKKCIPGRKNELFL